MTEIGYSLTTAFNKRADATDKLARRLKRQGDDRRNAANKANRARYNQVVSSFQHAQGSNPGTFEEWAGKGK